MMALRSCLLACALLVGSQAHAQSADAGAATTYSLSPEQKAAILNGTTESSAERARGGLGGPGPDRQIHGEVGAAVGTGGARGVFGTAAVPLGDNAGAVFSFEQSRFGDRRR